MIRNCPSPNWVGVSHLMEFVCMGPILIPESLVHFWKTVGKNHINIVKG